MATQLTRSAESYGVPLRVRLSREETCERYRELARAVVELAWRDACPDSVVATDIRKEAMEFLFSEAAEFWATVAEIPVRQLRNLVVQENERFAAKGAFEFTPGMCEDCYAPRAAQALRGRATPFPSLSSCAFAFAEEN